MTQARVEEDKKRSQQLGLAIKHMLVALPYLVGLSHEVSIEFDRRLPSAGIFASGRMLFNPDFFDQLGITDRSFVLAHEILHLMFNSHQRAVADQVREFNIAHDYIINAELKKALGLYHVPANGLDWGNDYFRYTEKYKPAQEYSAEEIVVLLKKNYHQVKLFAVDSEENDYVKGAFDAAEQRSSLAKALVDAGLAEKTDVNQTSDQQPSIADCIDRGELDVLPVALEKDWFVASVEEMSERRIARVIGKAWDSRQLQDTIKQFELDSGIGSVGGNTKALVEAKSARYVPPWQMALQSWLDAVTRSGRSYARPSRRGAGSSNVVLAGHNREGWTLHIVLDVSGSMAAELAGLLGMIASFCQASNVAQVHLLQADVEVTNDSWLAIDELYQLDKGLKSDN